MECKVDPPGPGTAEWWSRAYGVGNDEEVLDDPVSEPYLQLLAPRLIVPVLQLQQADAAIIEAAKSAVWAGAFITHLMDETERLFNRKAINIPTPRDLDAVEEAMHEEEEAAMQLVLKEEQKQAEQHGQEAPGPIPPAS